MAVAVASPTSPTNTSAALQAPVGGEREQDRRRDGPADEAGERMNRERAPDAVVGDAVGQQGVVGGVIDAVGEARHDGDCEQPGIGA